jgi:hypothetical protein
MALGLTTVGVIKWKIREWLQIPTYKHIRSYLQKITERKKQQSMLSLGRKKNWERIPIVFMHNGTSSTIDKQVATALFLPTFHQLLKVVNL